MDIFFHFSNTTTLITLASLIARIGLANNINATFPTYYLAFCISVLQRFNRGNHFHNKTLLLSKRIIKPKRCQCIFSKYLNQSSNGFHFDLQLKAFFLLFAPKLHNLQHKFGRTNHENRDAFHSGK